MKYRLQDLIDISLFQTLQERLNDVYKFPSAIIDNDGNVLTATAWQDVCTKFHRTHAACLEECVQSDKYIVAHIHEANPAVTYRCPRGLVDNAVPIVIAGQHLGNFFTGQVLLEPPDLDFYRGQAARFGFDEAAYLDAVRRVPVWPREKLDQHLQLIKAFTELLAGIGLRNLRELEARTLIEEKDRTIEETHAFHQQIIDSAEEGIVVYDREMRYRVWNPFMARLSKKDASEVLGKYFLDVFPFLAEVGMLGRVEAALRGETSPTVDFPYALPTGETGWTSDTCSPLFDNSGSIVGAIATVRDITARKLAETALQESKNRFKRLVHSVPLPLALYAGNTMIYFNERFTRVLGYDLHDIPTLDDWWRCAYPDPKYREETIASWTAAVQEARATGRDIPPGEYRVTCKDGSVRLMEISGIDLEGSAFVTFIDLTDRKRQEAAELTLQKLESLGTLAGGIAHDFNNVLTGILGNLSLLSDRLGNDDEQQMVREAMQASMAARGLAQQLLTFASGGTPVAKPLDIRQVLREAAVFAARGSAARCVFEVGETPLVVQADRDQLAQVVQNLVLNAAQSMPQGGVVQISASAVDLDDRAIPPLPAGRYVRCDVRDDGVGIAETYLAKVFDPYFTTKAKGRGLGLAVCHSIINKHSGRIVASSHPGRGAVFSFYLPAVDVSAWTSSAGVAARPHGTGRVLIMDDEAPVARVLGRMLRRLGYEASSAKDGQEAIAAYRSAMETNEPFDLVIMDLTIAGGLGGKETMVELLKLDPRVRAVVSSGYAMDPVMSQWAEHGFCGVLAKPYQLEDIARVVSQAMGRSGS